jgi:hypothetical protein
MRTPRQITTDSSSKQANSNIVKLHPVQKEYDRTKQDDRRILRQHRKDAEKKPVVGYVMIACLVSLGWFAGRLVWSLFTGM